MKPRTFALTLFAALVLVACSKNEDTANTATASAASAPTTANCAIPTLNNQIQQAIRQTISSEANRFAQADTHEMIDADKIIAAAAQLQISTTEAQPDRIPNTCQAKVSITIPQNILAQATANAPLLQTDTPTNVINTKIAGSNATFSNNTLNFTLSYSLQNNQFALTDNNLSGISGILADALTAYGVKDMVEINGTVVKRSEAIKDMKKGKTKEKEDKPKTASDVAPPPKDLPTIDERATLPTPPDAPSEKPEKLTPPASTQNKISENDLNNARQANQNADQSIKSAWRKIPPEIQRDLVQEQRSWEQRKQRSCRNAATKGSDVSESRYLLMQCDTRMTRERIQYLKGYSIDE